jgi:hypothetical protein
VQPGSDRHRQQEPGIVLITLPVAVSALLASDRNRNAFVLVLAADHGEGNSPRSLSKAQTAVQIRVAEEPGEFRPALLFAFSVLMRLAQAHPGPSAIPIDEFDAGSFQSAANR